MKFTAGCVSVRQKRRRENKGLEVRDLTRENNSKNGDKFILLAVRSPANLNLAFAPLGRSQVFLGEIELALWSHLDNISVD